MILYTMVIKGIQKYYMKKDNVKTELDIDTYIKLKTSLMVERYS